MKTIEITMVALFVALMGIGANISTFLVIGGVPITLQTFFAVLAGIVLGSRLGSISMTVYMLIGLIGIPIFSQFTGGLSTIIRPTFGFILSYIFTAAVVGYIVRNKKTIHTFIIASLVGMIINYVFGTNWMYFAYSFWSEAPEGLTYSLVWKWMLVPLPKDIIFSIIAAFIGYRLEKTVFAKSLLRRTTNL